MTEEALAAPQSAFPSWFLRIECTTCGRERYANTCRTGTKRSTSLVKVFKVFRPVLPACLQALIVRTLSAPVHV